MTRHMAALTLSLVLGAASRGRAEPLEVPLSWSSRGLCTASLGVGTPRQSVSVSVDSGSGVLWVPDEIHGKPGFNASASATLRMDKEGTALEPYADGLSVKGDYVHDVIALYGAARKEPWAGVSPLLVARNTSTGSHETLDPEGILGLSCSSGNGHADDEVEGFFCNYWRDQGGDGRRTLLLTFGLGETRPRMRLGADLREGPREEGGVHFAGDYYSSRSSRWFIPIRALGLSQKTSSLFAAARGHQYSLAWHVDFNTVLPRGAVGWLDSGTKGIRVSSALHALLVKNLPAGCAAEPDGESVRCPCPEGPGSFPSISLSIEARGNARFMGLDLGADFVVCIPPSAYVSEMGGDGRTCRVAFTDGGPRQTAFDTEAIVLGVPFFRSMAVGYDVDSHLVAVGRGSSAPECGGDAAGPCQCLDPKNWWQTGKRLSWKRVMVSLLGVSLLSAYIFLVHSPSPQAAFIRMSLGGLRPTPPAPAATGGSPGHIELRAGSSLFPGTGGAAGANSARGIIARSRAAAAAGGYPMMDDHEAFVAMQSESEGGA